MTSWVEVARPNKNHMIRSISVVASNYSQCPELGAFIHMHVLPQPQSKKKKEKRHFIRNLDLFCCQTQLLGLKCAACGSMLCRLSSLLLSLFSLKVSRLLKRNAG